MVTFTCIFVTITLFLTTLATLFLTLSLFSDEWEYMTYKTDAVEKVAKSKNSSVQWIEKKTARITLPATFQKEFSISDSANESIGVACKKCVMYLVPAFGGVNKLCVDISGSSLIFLFFNTIFFHIAYVS